MRVKAHKLSKIWHLHCLEEVTHTTHKRKACSTRHSTSWARTLWSRWSRRCKHLIHHIENIEKSRWHPWHPWWMRRSCSSCWGSWRTPSCRHACSEKSWHIRHAWEACSWSSKRERRWLSKENLLLHWLAIYWCWGKLNKAIRWWVRRRSTWSDHRRHRRRRYWCCLSSINIDSSMILLLHSWRVKYHSIPRFMVSFLKFLSGDFFFSSLLDHL